MQHLHDATTQTAFHKYLSSSLDSFGGVEQSEQSQDLYHVERTSSTTIGRTTSEARLSLSTARTSQQQRAWSAFFDSADLLQIEQNPDGAGSCWAGVFSLSLAKLLYLPIETLAAMYPVGSVGSSTAAAGEKSEKSDIAQRRSILLYALSQEGFGETLATLPWQDALNTGFPVADLLHQAQEIILDRGMISSTRRGDRDVFYPQNFYPDTSSGSEITTTAYFHRRLIAFFNAFRSADPAKKLPVDTFVETEQDQAVGGSLETLALNVLLDNHISHQKDEQGLDEDLHDRSASASSSEGGAGHQRERNSTPPPEEDQINIKATFQLLLHACAHLTLALFTVSRSAQTAGNLPNGSKNLDLRARLQAASGRVRAFVDVLQKKRATVEQQMEEHQTTIVQQHQQRNPLLALLQMPLPFFWLLQWIDEQVAPRSRAEAIVVVGRKDRLEILQYYLHNSLRIHGGALDKINFVVHNAIDEEIQFISSLIQQHPHHYAAPSVYGKRLAKFYSFANLRKARETTVYVKLDDDIVFLSRNAIRDVVREKWFRQKEVSLVSGNIVNHAILSAVHNEFAGVPDMYGPVIDPAWETDDEKRRLARKEVLLNKGSSRTSNGQDEYQNLLQSERDRLLDTAAEEDEKFRKSQEMKKKKQKEKEIAATTSSSPPEGATSNVVQEVESSSSLSPEQQELWAPQIEKHPQGTCVWARWECAEWVHRSFLHFYHTRSLATVYTFHRYNFHLYGYGNPRERVLEDENGNSFVDTEIIPLQHSRWSINFFAFMASDLENVDVQKLVEDDESQLSYVQPFQLQKPSIAVGSALAVHFSYGKQDRGLMDYTRLLASYRNLTFYDYY
ncbi:unnamed protein product [Amoebophrya sp. A120]|nr:unnamed protein product [Amoebophrya sp. A120]|eukprot:GSA120T00000389001.1